MITLLNCLFQSIYYLIMKNITYYLNTPSTKSNAQGNINKVAYMSIYLAITLNISELLLVAVAVLITLQIATNNIIQ